MSIASRETRMESVAAEIETNLILVGATGVEDKLQEGGKYFTFLLLHVS